MLLQFILQIHPNAELMQICFEFIEMLIECVFLSIFLYAAMKIKINKELNSK